MPQFVKLSSAERNELILKASSKLNISPVLVEKDFWVSWLLNKIFQHEISKDITFKGGTSLSKCYGIISRFSEDIDLTINRSIFNEIGNESELSNKGLQRLIHSNDQKATEFVCHFFKPLLENVIEEELGKSGWQMTQDDYDLKNLRFCYPSSLKTIDNPYIKQSVLIELGVRGEVTPYETKTVTSYIDQLFSNIIDFEVCQIRTLSPERTFWEKVTLLHAENNRPKEKDFKDRLSRHYYDIYQLVKNGVADTSIKNFSLLYNVIDHKRKYFRASWAKYEEAIPGTITIYPHNDLHKNLMNDYKQMEHMLFGEIPDFNTIIQTVKILENKLNHIKC